MILSASFIPEFLTSQSFWVKTVELLAALSLLIVVHEFGHYSFSRLFGVWVEKFYMFFNPWFSIWKWKPKAKTDSDGNEVKSSWRATEYGIGWVPLGGYCKISGMIDESMDTEQMKQPAQPWEFRSKPAWQRLFIMIGGVLFNFLLAIIIYAGLVFTYGEEFLPYRNAPLGMTYCESAHKIGFQEGDIPLEADGRALEYLTADELQAIVTSKQVKVLRNGHDTVAINIPKNYIFTANSDVEKNGKGFMTYRLPVVVSQVSPRMGAEKAQLLKGDEIIAVNGVNTADYSTFTEQLMAHKGKTAPMTVKRAGNLITKNVEIDGNGKIGILLTPINEVYKTITKSYNIFQSVPRGIQLGWEKLANYVGSLKYLFTKQGAQSLGGFGAIGSIFPETFNWIGFWEITAFISVILAVMNILPIPALDGGYVLFLLVEVITGKKPSEKFLEYAVTIGMALLFALLIYANGNDIYRYFFK